MKFLLALLVALPTFAATNDFIEKQVYPATALLYKQSDDGQMKMLCTATAFEKTADGYKFVTAAHCGCTDDTDKEVAKPEKGFFFLTSDDGQSKDFMAAKPEICGYRHEGDDFFVLSVKTDKAFPIIKVGSDPKMLDRLANVSSPAGLGKQIFQGNVSSPVLNRPVIQDDINWTGAVMIQMFGINGGSSGSSVICVDQAAICAFIVGSIENTNLVALPVSRFVKFQQQVAAGTYEYSPKKKK